jgi:uncharacterized BrkB/YihY/UPF0761 family membrane protein
VSVWALSFGAPRRRNPIEEAGGAVRVASGARPVGRAPLPLPWDRRRRAATVNDEIDDPVTWGETKAPPTVDDASAPPGRRDALRSRLAAMSRRADGERQRHVSVDAAFIAGRRMSLTGGSLLASAVAYRGFLVLLPLALVVVAGLGFARSADTQAPSTIARQFGVTGVVARSVREAASEGQPGRWWTLLLGTLLLLWAAYSLTRAVRTVHALAWGMQVRRWPQAGRATLIAIGVIVLMSAAGTLGARGQTLPFFVWLFYIMAAFLLYAAVWSWAMWLLPHPDVPWTAMIPGAILFAAAIKLMHLVTQYYLAPRLDRTSALYGSLGVAATVLLGLFIFGMILVVSAVLNASLWEARQARERRAASAVDD